MVSLVVLFFMLSVCALPNAAQEQEPASAAGPAAEVLQYWNRIAKRLIDMAEDFPEEKYDYKPTPEVRSFADQLLHVAAANFAFIRAARGEAGGSEHHHLSRDTYKTKADVVAVLKKSYAEGAALIEQAGDAGMSRPLKHPFANRMVSQYGFWMFPIITGGEHYGNLVVYYRLNGLVPPVSRRPGS
jgi:uncharacterized damage-inducible protein DinB